MKLQICANEACRKPFPLPRGQQARRKYCTPECSEAVKRSRNREFASTYWRQRPPCTFKGCLNPIASVDLCAGHKAQERARKPLAPLKPKAQKRWYEPKDDCSLPGCPEVMWSKSLCMRHDSQRRKTSLETAIYVAVFAQQAGHCAYCRDVLGEKFEIDHAHDGICALSHPDASMCPDCIRGFVHQLCNQELKWLERAIRAGRIPQPAPDVARYLAGRPFREHIGG